MITIRKFVYAAALAVSAMTFAPSHAVAQAPAHGKFTLTHDVYWGNATVPAGTYAFSYDPYETAKVLTISKLDGARAGYMVLVPATDDGAPADSNQILLEKTADGSYVSAMQLAECGVTLHFAAPSHPAKQLAKSGALMASSGR